MNRETETKTQNNGADTATRKDEIAVLVREEIRQTFGSQVTTSGDCNRLSEEILRRTSFRINPNTLRRFFGLVKTEHQPSYSTLNILSQFCGYESFDDLTKKAMSQHGNEAEGNGSADFLEYVISIFKYVPAKEYNDETFMAIVRRTVMFLQQHPSWADRFQRAIAKTRNGQDFYFEQFVNIDYLNSFYGRGLHFYLNEKKTSEAQIFGHSLLCMRAWLCDDAGELKKHHAAVMQYRVNKSIHPFVCGRYFASQVFYADMFNQPIEPILAKAAAVHLALKPAKYNYRLFPAFEAVLSWALLLTGHAADALYYLEYGTGQYTGRHEYIEENVYQSVDLSHALALVKDGRREEARSIFNRIQPFNFYFLIRKVNTIFYLCLKKQLKTLSTADQEQLEDLVAQTGFTRITKNL